MSIRIASATFALLTLPVLAIASPAETDLEQLRDLRDRAVAAAATPINELYRASLDQLLRRAVQDGDTAGAAKIKLELQSLAETITPAPAETAEASRMRALLRGSEWQFSPGKTITLHGDGSITASWHGRKGSWKVVAPNVLELTYTNAPREPSKVSIDSDATTMIWALKEGEAPYPEVAKRVGAPQAQ